MRSAANGTYQMTDQFTCIKESSYYSSRLILSDLILSELSDSEFAVNVKLYQWDNPAQTTSLWLVAATANWVASRCIH